MLERLMLEAETRVAQEGAGQRRLPANASEAAAQGPAQAGQIRRTHIGELAGLHVAPDLLKGIQLRGIRRQALHAEPGALAPQVRRHVSTLVTAQAVPDQDRKSTRLNSSHGYISYAVFCLKKKKNNK